jgi:hypothetical protein
MNSVPSTLVADVQAFQCTIDRSRQAINDILLEYSKLLRKYRTHRQALVDSLRSCDLEIIHDSRIKVLRGHHRAVLAAYNALSGTNRKQPAWAGFHFKHLDVAFGDDWVFQSSFLPKLRRLRDKHQLSFANAIERIVQAQRAASAKQVKVRHIDTVIESLERQISTGPGGGSVEDNTGEQGSNEETEVQGDDESRAKRRRLSLSVGHANNDETRGFSVECPRRAESQGAVLSEDSLVFPGADELIESDIFPTNYSISSLPRDQRNSMPRIEMSPPTTSLKKSSKLSQVQQWRMEITMAKEALKGSEAEATEADHEVYQAQLHALLRGILNPQAQDREGDREGDIGAADAATAEAQKHADEARNSVTTARALVHNLQEEFMELSIEVLKPLD